MGRKAQITLFLIFGIALVIGLALVTYSATIQNRSKVTVETEKLSRIQLQINPLNNFMDGCVNDLLKDDLDAAGLDATEPSTIE